MIARLIRPEPIRAAVLEGRIRPLSRSLALRMLTVCCAPSPWGVSAIVVDDPPSSLDMLLDRWDGSGPVPVSGEHAHHTIWGHPNLNALFRAWHDSIHVLLSAGFDRAGEHMVAKAQLKILENPADRAILWAETAGQDEFFRLNGAFPRLQRAFVVHAVQFGLESALLAGARGMFQ